MSLHFSKGRQGIELEQQGEVFSQYTGHGVANLLLGPALDCFALRLNDVVSDITAGELEGFTAFMANIEVKNPLPLVAIGGAGVQMTKCSRGRSSKTIKIGAGFTGAGQLDSSSKCRWESGGTSPASTLVIGLS